MLNDTVTPIASKSDLEIAEGGSLRVRLLQVRDFHKMAGWLIDERA